MAKKALDRSLGSGVCFPVGAHAGFIRRLLSTSIDVTAVAIMLYGLLFVSYFVSHIVRTDLSVAALLVWVFSSWLYLTTIKASKLRTLGYRATGVKIVDQKGNRPSTYIMTVRLFLTWIGPFNPLTDLLWIGADTNGRSLRDCYTRTHVVKKTATPTGTAPLFMVYYNALGCNFAYPSATSVPSLSREIIYEDNLRSRVPMSNDAASNRESDDAAADTGTAPESATEPWVSRLASIACIGIFLGLAIQNDYESWATLSQFGYLPADSIWNGGYWALVTSAFVHFALWHVAFNVYWLWVLGSCLERAIGSLPFLAFFVVSAMVSSSFQLAVSDNTGIGASGVVYAIFGFMWPTRHRYPSFNQVLDGQTIPVFIIWLGGCVVATYLKIWDVGNAAHISGLLFGGAVAGAFVLRLKPRVMFSGLVTLVVFSIVPLFWCPWSVTWLSNKAYNAHAAERYDAAIDRYTQIIHLDPESSWAYLNRSFAYQALGQPDKAQADLQRAREIDPSIEVAN